MMAVMMNRIKREPAVDRTMIRAWREAVERWSQSLHDDRYMTVGLKMGRERQAGRSSAR